MKYKHDASKDLAAIYESTVLQPTTKKPAKASSGGQFYMLDIGPDSDYDPREIKENNYDFSDSWLVYATEIIKNKVGLLPGRDYNVACPKFIKGVHYEGIILYKFTKEQINKILNIKGEDGATLFESSRVKPFNPDITNNPEYFIVNPKNHKDPYYRAW